MIVRFPRTQFSGGQDDQLDRRVTRPDRIAILVRQFALRPLAGPTQDRLGGQGERFVGRFERFFTEQVPRADLQMGAVLEALHHRPDVGGPTAEFDRRVLEPRGRWQAVEHQRIDQLVDHPRIADQNPRQVRAAGAESHEQAHRRRRAAHQFPQRRLATKRIADFGQGLQRLVRSGRGADFRQQPRGDRGEVMPTAATRQIRHRLIGQTLQIDHRRGRVGHPVRTEHPLRHRLVRYRIEQQFGLQRHLRRTDHGLLQQLPDDLATGLERLFESLRKRGFVTPTRRVAIAEVPRDVSHGSRGGIDVQTMFAPS